MPKQVNLGLDNYIAIFTQHSTTTVATAFAYPINTKWLEMGMCFTPPV